MYNKDLIRDIFNSGSYTFRVDEQLIVDITFLVNEGLLKLESKVISDIKKYHQYNDDLMLDKSMAFDAEGGGIGHMALKYVGKDYLSEIGYEKVNFEHQYEGYVPDIMTPDQKIIIECGNTNPDKVFKYFKNKALEQLIIIPYPDSESEKLMAYIFKPGNELSEFLKFREIELAREASNSRNR